MPIGIPQPRVHATATSTLDSIAAAVVASSPQMHAQAHAAAMAAVQMQMNMQQQQQQQQGRSIPIYNPSSAGGAGAGGVGGGVSSSPYIAAHSLQRIMDPPSSSGFLGARTSSGGGESLNQWRVGSFPNNNSGGGGGGRSGQISSSLLNNPGMSLFSPPSRSFGVHLQSMASDHQLPPPSFDPGYSTSPHRIIPLMHLPNDGFGSGSEQPDTSPIPFQPSSVSTYRSTLAATAAAAGASVDLPSVRQQQLQQQQYTATAAAARREPLQRTAGFVVPGSATSGGGDGSDNGNNLPEAMSIPIESSHTPITPLPPSTGGDGNGEDVSPPELKQESPEGDVSNPDADWDPLWTDDLLTEEESFDQNRSTSKIPEASPPVPSPSPKGSSLVLAAQHLTQLQPLNPLGGETNAGNIDTGVKNAAFEVKTAAKGFTTTTAIEEEPCSPHGSLMEGISHAQDMMWSPPRTAVVNILKSLPDGGAITQQQQQHPQQQLEPLQRLHGFVVSTDKEEEKEKGNDGD
jgi:hypothetical protein